MKKGDKQGVFVRKEMQTMVGRLPGNLFHLSVPHCVPLSLFIPVNGGAHQAATDNFIFTSHYFVVTLEFNENCFVACGIDG